MCMHICIYVQIQYIHIVCRDKGYVHIGTHTYRNYNTLTHTHRGGHTHRHTHTETYARALTGTHNSARARSEHRDLQLVCQNTPHTEIMQLLSKHSLGLGTFQGWTRSIGDPLHDILLEGAQK